MPAKRPRAVVLLILAVILLAACGEAEGLDSPAMDVLPTSTPLDVSSSSPEATPTTTPEPVTHVVDEAMPTAEAADDRLRDRNEYGMLDAWMGGLERDTFAGGFIEHEPEHRYILLFTRDGEETLYRYVKPGSDLDEFIEIRTAQFSYSDLYAATGELNQAFSDLGYFPPSSIINVMRNRLEYMVNDPERIARMFTDAGISVPESVDLIPGGGVLVSLDAPEDVPGVYIAILKPQPPVETDAAFWEYTGTLVLEDGCLWIVSGGHEQRAMPIWDDGHRLHVDGDAIEVVNSAGIVVARVGEPIYLSGHERDQEHLDRGELYTPIPEACELERIVAGIYIEPLAHQPDMAMREPGYAPSGLFSVLWPMSFADAEAFARLLPEHIGDGSMKRWIDDDGSDRIEIGYGPQDDPGAPRLTVTDLTTGRYFPDYWNVNDLIASQFMGNAGRETGFSEAASWALEDTSITGRTDRYGSVPVHALTWGSNEGRVLFVAAAADYSQLEMLVAAVVAAAQ